MENPFVKLFAIDFKDHLEVKKSGNTELKYVSWAYAWAEVKKLYPAASYEVKKFNGLPYVYDPITGFMVYTSVTIEGVSHEMWLPVLDGANKAIKDLSNHRANIRMHIPIRFISVRSCLTVQEIAFWTYSTMLLVMALASGSVIKAVSSAIMTMLVFSLQPRE